VRAFVLPQGPAAPFRRWPLGARDPAKAAATRQLCAGCRATRIFNPLKYRNKKSGTGLARHGADAALAMIERWRGVRMAARTANGDE